MLSFHNLLIWAYLGGFMMTVLSIFFPWKNAVLMLIALRFHLFDAIRVIAICPLFLEQVGDSVLKPSTSSNPLAHSLTFVDHLLLFKNPAYGYCRLTIVLNFIKYFFWSLTLKFFFLGIQDFEVNLGDIHLVYQDLSVELA